MSQCDSRFFGKYRGNVKDNKDPLKLGRLKIIVPLVLGKNESWAMPCVPYAGKKVGFFALPPKDANVWIEFEAGDLDHPIWTGCFWDKDEIPADPPEENMKVFKTDSLSLIMDDKKSLTLEVGKPALDKPIKLLFDKSGIDIKCGNTNVKLEEKKATFKSGEVEISNDSFNIKLTSSKVVVNDGALEVI